MSITDSGVPPTAVPFWEGVHCYASSPFRASLPQPFPGVEEYLHDLPSDMAAPEKEAFACLRRDLAAGLGKSWGHAGSPFGRWIPVPADAWPNLRLIDADKASFGFDIAQPDTCVWNVHVDPVRDPGRPIEYWEYLDVAALGLALHFGQSVESAELDTANALFIGRPSPPVNREQSDRECWDGQAAEVIRSSQHHDFITISQPEEAPPPEFVELVTLRCTNFIPYTEPIGRVGDISIRMSRIIPGYDLISDSTNVAAVLRMTCIEEVFVSFEDLIRFCSRDRQFGTRLGGERYAACGHEDAKRTTLSTIRAQTECTKWLLKLMRQGPPIKKKQDYENEAKLAFKNLSGKGFQYAWRNAVAQSGNAEWSKSGPKTRKG